MTTVEIQRVAEIRSKKKEKQQDKVELKDIKHSFAAPRIRP